MNRYARLALEHNRRFHPREFERIPDREEFFAEAGHQIEADVTRLRDQILGAQRPEENLEQYRLRSYQALQTAEEVVLADHHLLLPPPDGAPEAMDDDPELAASYRDSAELSRALQEAHDILTTPDP